MLCSEILDRRLGACIQILDITSWYVWQGKRETEPEKLLLIKTRADLYAEIEATLSAVHPYETPEIISVPIATGTAGYLAWIDQVTAGAPSNGPKSEG
ncbi:MAG: divalent-cation tolerance protein CutA [Chloroflexi bacterium]|nr:divalent-cation tolerance protein CutA [Chloroflexota bacterium]